MNINENEIKYRFKLVKKLKSFVVFGRSASAVIRLKIEAIRRSETIGPVAAKHL